MTDATDCDRKANNDECFSAQDYAFLILELNGKMSSQPYDPKEFSAEIQR